MRPKIKQRLIEFEIDFLSPINLFSSSTTPHPHNPTHNQIKVQFLRVIILKRESTKNRSIELKSVSFQNIIEPSELSLSGDGIDNSTFPAPTIPVLNMLKKRYDC